MLFLREYDNEAASSYLILFNTIFLVPYVPCRCSANNILFIHLIVDCAIAMKKVPLTPGSEA